MLIVNHLFLKQALSKSDIIAFFVILLAFAISFSNLVSKAAGIPIPKKDKTKQTETVTLDNKEYVGK